MYFDDADILLTSAPSQPLKAQKKPVPHFVFDSDLADDVGSNNSNDLKPEQWKELALSLHKENTELKQENEEYKKSLNELQQKLIEIKAIYGCKSPKVTKTSQKTIETLGKENETLKSERKNQTAIIKNLTQKLSVYNLAFEFIKRTVQLGV